MPNKIFLFSSYNTQGSLACSNITDSEIVL